MDGRRKRMAPRRAIAATVVLAAVFAPAAGDAGPLQQDLASQAPGGATGPGDGPALGIDIDVAYAEPGEVADALDGLVSGVADQLSALEGAEAAVRGGEEAVEEAKEVVEATEARIEALVLLSDEVVVDAFVNPPAESAFDALSTATVSEMVVKQVLLSIQADEDADVLQQLDAERADLDKQKAHERELAQDAAAARAEADAELATLETATTQQAEFVIEVEQRLERQAAEADALEDLDPELAERLRADQAALAAKIREILEAREFEAALEALAEARRKAEEEAARQAAEAAETNSDGRGGSGGGAVELGSASGSLANVSCSGGGSITVDRTLADNLTRMLSAAAADGVRLCGTGYRDPQRQIELRRSNCGSSNYAIYEAPASSCSPPTARPGTSLHEQGLAIDFTCNGGGVISSQGSPCFVWLNNNAASYGLYNLPSEPWHWSTDGT